MSLVFQYGSNTDAVRLNDSTRLDKTADDLGLAQTVTEYQIAFTVWSNGNGCAASDLLDATGTGRRARGVLYNVPTDRVFGKGRADRKTLEEIEGPKYEVQPIRVRKANGEEVEAQTFLVKATQRREGLWTSADYVGHIVGGLRTHGLEAVDPAYIRCVIDVALETNQKAVDRAEAESEAIRRLRGD